MPLWKDKIGCGLKLFSATEKFLFVHIVPKKKILSAVQLNLEVDANFVHKEETLNTEKAQKIMERS